MTQYTFDNMRFGCGTKVIVNGSVFNTFGVDFGSSMIAIRVEGRKKLQWLPRELCELVPEKKEAPSGT
jgi:hypothetical protein